MEEGVFILNMDSLETSPMDLEPPVETPVGERTEVPTPLMLRFVEASPQQNAQYATPPHVLPPLPDDDLTAKSIGPSLPHKGSRT